MPPVLPQRAAWDRVTAATRRVENMPVDLVGRRMGRRKTAFAFAARNESGAAAPRGAVLEITARDDWVLTYGQPGADVEVVGINTGDVATGETGTAWLWGLVPVLCDDYEDEYLGPQVGDRLGAQDGSWYAAKSDFGPLVYLGAVPAADQPTGLPAGVGLVWAVFWPGLTEADWVYLTTSDEEDGEITAKRVDSDGNVVGEDITFVVLPEPS